MLTKDEGLLISFNGGEYTRYESPWGDVLWYVNRFKTGQIYSEFLGGSTCELEKQYKTISVSPRKITNWLRLK